MGQAQFLVRLDERDLQEIDDHIGKLNDRPRKAPTTGRRAPDPGVSRTSFVVDAALAEVRREEKP